MPVSGWDNCCPCCGKESYLCPDCETYRTHITTKKETKWKETKCGWCKKKNGNSESVTKTKERMLASAMDVYLKLAGTRLTRPFDYFDFNTGPALNMQGVPSCAVGTIIKLVKRKRRFRAILCDNCSDFLCDTRAFLERSLWDHIQYIEGNITHLSFGSTTGTIEYFRGNNNGLPGLVRRRLSESKDWDTPFGPAVIDPNGPSKRSTPYEELEALHNEYQKLDLLFNFGFGTLVRDLAVKKIPHDIPEWLYDGAFGIQEKYKNRFWYINKPIGTGTSRFVIMLGVSQRLNFFGPISSDGFHFLGKHGCSREAPSGTALEYAEETVTQRRKGITLLLS